MIRNLEGLGYHIRTLVLRFLLLYCKPLIEAGRVYIGVSPLYHVNKGKSTWKYYTDKAEFNKYVQKQFSLIHTLLNIKTKKHYTASQTQNIINENYRYMEFMNNISTTYAIHPILLEDIILNRNLSYAKFKKAIESKYRFLTVYQKNGFTIVDGLAFEKQHTIILNQQLVNEFNVLIPFLDASDKQYILDGKKIGLYELLTIFQQSEPKNVERTKGLGSMEAQELGVCTLTPENRKLIRYTSQDIDSEIADMRRANDDKFSLIQGLDISQYEF